MSPTKKTVLLTRKVEFAASHRLYKDEFTEAENFDLYGKCANPYGHGHNYVLEVTVKGPQDPRTELVVHYSELKKLLKELVEVPFDHHNLNEDVEAMKGVLPCSENITLVLWDLLSNGFKDQPFSLYKLKLISTERNWVEYYGPQS